MSTSDCASSLHLNFISFEIVLCKICMTKVSVEVN